MKNKPLLIGITTLLAGGMIGATFVTTTHSNIIKAEENTSYTVTINKDNRPVRYGENNYYFKLDDRDNYGYMYASIDNKINTSSEYLVGKYADFAFAWTDNSSKYFDFSFEDLGNRYKATIGGQQVSLRGFPNPTKVVFEYAIEGSTSNPVNAGNQGWDRSETGPVDGVYTSTSTRNSDKMASSWSMGLLNYNEATLYIKSMTIFYDC